MNIIELEIEENSGILVELEQGSKEWLEWRKSGVCASDVPAIMGDSKWATALSIFMSKVGLDQKQEENENMEWGHRLEGSILQKFLDNHPEQANHQNSPCFVHKVFSFIRASLDAITRSEGSEGFDSFIIEIKTTGNMQGWGTDEEPEIPLYYLEQVCWQMITTGIRKAYLAVLYIGQGKHYFERYVELNDKAADVIINQCATFWDGVIQLTPPPPTTNVNEQDSKAIARFFDKCVDTQKCDIGEGMLPLVIRRNQLESNIDIMETEKNQIENQIKMLSGNAKYIECIGQKVAQKKIVKRDGKTFPQWKFN
jgi:putative phage-type endonuclease